MATHLRLLAFGFIVLGIAGGLVSLIALIAMGGPGGMSSNIEGTAITFAASGSILGPIIAGVALLNFLLAVPCVLAGLGLLRFQTWARSLCMVLCALQIANFPLGTVLAIYGLWILTSMEVEPLFETARPRN